MSSLQIAYISPEVVPFVKTGGLADVAGALPDALAKMGNTVKVFLPLYSSISKKKYGIKPLKSDIPITAVSSQETFDLYHSSEKTAGCEYYFIKMDKYFDRDDLYLSPETGKDYKDNDERFIAFSKAVLESIIALEWKPEIIHCNDWQSGLIPAIIKYIDYGAGYFKQTRTVFTIHNIAYQGLFPAKTFLKLDIEKTLFFPTSGFEYYGKISFLKVGLNFADVLTTVSKRYAKEIQSSEEYGCGMEGILRDRTNDLYGVLNGIDYDIWDPAADELIKANYQPDKLANKKKNKNALRKINKLPMVRRDVPLIGMISRFADQKGFDLLAEAADDIFELDIQMVILGSGDEKYEKIFAKLAKKYPKKLAVNVKFDNKLAHLIEAGSDMFLMPSRYEPCGLNQLYSLKYGTVPIVRETGGLADTITNCNPVKNTGNGFVFKDYDSSELLNVIKFAVEVYKSKKAWTDIMKRGMMQDFSWDSSAKKYMQIYKKALEK
ncbi:MAG: glycogen synthase GlgA [candidate division Zixibacteria bacterium]|nr:glycogen synthase GlgA [candidate division Zixibacteria bacterium]